MPPDCCRGEFFQYHRHDLVWPAFFLLVLALVLEKLRPHLLWPLLALAGWTNFAVHTQVLLAARSARIAAE